MTRYLLDTNIISEPFKLEPDLSVVTKLQEASTESMIASVSWHELLYGLYRMPNSRRKQQLDKTGRIRVVVQDNGPVHTCKKVKAKWAEWEAQGLYFFFLPKYCSELNPIETEWHQLKTHELKGQMFDHELDLAYAVMDGVDARAEAGGYEAERFRFPSQLAS